MTQHDDHNKNDQDVSYRIAVEAPGFKFGMDDTDSWQLVAKVVVLILSVYGGIHLINYYL